MASRHSVLAVLGSACSRTRRSTAISESTALTRLPRRKNGEKTLPFFHWGSIGDRCRIRDAYKRKWRLNLRRNSTHLKLMLDHTQRLYLHDRPEVWESVQALARGLLLSDGAMDGNAVLGIVREAGPSYWADPPWPPWIGERPVRSGA